MSKFSGRVATFSAFLVATAGSALAHPGHGDHAAVTPGLDHPVLGWDHAAIAIALGLAIVGAVWAVRRAKR